MFRVWIILFGFIWAAGCGMAPRSAADEDPLRVYAAASLTEAFEEIGRSFTQRTGQEVLFNFDGSSGLRLQINQGAPADVFASADEAQMEQVIQGAGILDEPRIFARNKLSLIVPADQEDRIRELHDLARPGIRLVLAHPSVPAGNYARLMLAEASQDPAYGSDFADRVLSNLRSEETNVKQVLAKVVLGEADAGIVYVSDLGPGSSGQVVQIEIPESFNQIAQYPIAVLAGSERPELAERFVEYVMSEEGQAVLTKHGFLGIESPAVEEQQGESH